MRKSLLAALLNASAIGGGSSLGIAAQAFALPSTGRTSLSAAATAVPSGNKVTVTNASASAIPLEYTL